MSQRWTEAEIQYLVDTYTTKPSTRQAQELGRTVYAVRNKRDRLIQDGKIDPTKRAFHRLWTDEETDQVIGWLQDGLSVPIIAKRLGRSTNAVICRLERNDISRNAVRDSDIAQVMNAYRVAKLLGVGESVVRKWVARKVIKARRDGSRIKARRKQAGGFKKARYLITDQAIMDFMAKSDYWYAWTVDGIADPDWREYAASVRPTRSGEWVELKAFARRMGYSPYTVIGWRDDGYMSSIRTIRGGGLVYFWSADLAGFVPPLDRRYKVAA